jgi:hypothetical protein
MIAGIANIDPAANSVVLSTRRLLMFMIKPLMFANPLPGSP